MDDSNDDDDLIDLLLPGAMHVLTLSPEEFKQFIDKHAGPRTAEGDAFWKQWSENHWQEEEARWRSLSPEERERITYSSWHQEAINGLKRCRSLEEEQEFIDSLRHEAAPRDIDVSRIIEVAIAAARQQLALQAARREADEHITVIPKARDHHFAPPAEAPERGAP